MKYGITDLTIKSLMRKNWYETEMRVDINKKKVEQYAKEIEEGCIFPKPVCFICPKTEVIYVGDGFHRILAYQFNGEKVISVNLNRGGKSDAILHNIKSNKNQLGLPMSTGDKQNCILTLLQMEETRQLTQSEIANIVGSSQSYVSWLVKKFEIDRPKVTVDKNGRVMTNLHKVKNRGKIKTRRDKVVELIYKGKSQVEIADELNLSRSTIQRDIEEAGRQQQLVECPHCKGSGYIKKGNK